MRNNKVKQLSYMAMFSALCYVGTLIHIPINIGSSSTMIHLGNVFLLIAALSLGGFKGGLSAAVGMSIFDLTNGWATYAPSTFILKLVMGLVCGSLYTLIKKKKINYNLKIILPLIAGGITNIILDPIVTTYLRKWIFGLESEATSLLLKYESFATLINAVIAILLSFVMYKAIKKSHLLDAFEKNNNNLKNTVNLQ